MDARHAPTMRLCAADVWAMALVAAALLALAAACGGGRGDPTACIPADQRGEGIRVTLVTVWNSNPEFLPANIGITDDCTRPLHTIDDSSYVYIAGEGEFTVGDFLEVWTDNPSTRPGAVIESVSLNGQRFEGDHRTIVFEDEQRIVLAYTDMPLP